MTQVSGEPTTFLLQVRDSTTRPDDWG